MADRDSAFLWETEALRSSDRRYVSERGASSTGAILEAGDWLTLREASEVTGVPTDTIRKWARHENVPSFLEKTDEGHVRVVSLTGIRHWADEIGRKLEAPETSDAVDTTGTEIEVDLTPTEQDEQTSAEPDVPEGSMLVPLDAWNKMLNQLGNLHEAGQQLAEARERAAKAETESRFLKERLSELRSELERAKESTVAQPEPLRPSEDRTGTSDRPPTTSTTLRGTAASLARKLYQGWRQGH